MCPGVCSIRICAASPNGSSSPSRIWSALLASDPIAAQFVPSAAELADAPDDRADPVGDERWSPVPGIVHRYPDRVLLKPILVCPVYCRFCFRREQVGKDDGVLSSEALDRALCYIRVHPEIWEVIVTGGDPFLLSPRRIGAILGAIEAIAAYFARDRASRSISGVGGPPPCGMATA